MAFACGIASLFVCLCTLEEIRSGGEILAQCAFVRMSVVNASGIIGRFTTCPSRPPTHVLQTHVPIQLPTFILAQVSHPHSLTAHKHHIHRMRFRHCYYTRTLDPANLGLLLSPHSSLPIYIYLRLVLALSALLLRDLITASISLGSMQLRRGCTHMCRVSSSMCCCCCLSFSRMARSLGGVSYLYGGIEGRGRRRGRRGGGRGKRRTLRVPPA